MTQNAYPASHAAGPEVPPGAVAVLLQRLILFLAVVQDGVGSFAVLPPRLPHHQQPRRAQLHITMHEFTCTCGVAAKVVMEQEQVQSMSQ